MRACADELQAPAGFGGSDAGEDRAVCSRVAQQHCISCKGHAQAGCLCYLPLTSCSMMAAMRRSFSCRGMHSGSCSSALVMMVSLTCAYAVPSSCLTCLWGAHTRSMSAMLASAPAGAALHSSRRDDLTETLALGICMHGTCAAAAALLETNVLHQPSIFVGSLLCSEGWEMGSPWRC